MNISSLNLSKINNAVSNITDTVRKSKLLIENINKKVGESNERIRTRISNSAKLFQRRQQAIRRRIREDLIEASGIGGALRRANKIASSSSRGFLGRILDFVGTILVGWAIVNIPKIIVVGISHLGKKRYSEYTPAKPRSEINKRKSKADISLLEVYDKHGITSDKFLKFMVEELKPFIDTNYKTISGRDGTFLAGSSMGGLISAYAICEYPNVFGGAACMSTHWPVMDGFFIEYLKSNLPNPLTHKIYFDYGTLGFDAEYEPYQVVVDSLMVLNGYEIKKNWITKKFEGDNHHEDYWRRRFHHPIKFLLNENK